MPQHDSTCQAWKCSVIFLTPNVFAIGACHQKLPEGRANGAQPHKQVGSVCSLSFLQLRPTCNGNSAGQRVCSVSPSETRTAKGPPHAWAARFSTARAKVQGHACLEEQHVRACLQLLRGVEAARQPVQVVWASNACFG